MTISTFAENDIHGHRSIPGRGKYMTAKRAKEIRLAQKTLAPRAKNGITCPFTYWHILDALLEVHPGNLFTAKEFTDSLGERPMSFDPITVGRVINDIAESLQLANHSEPIQIIRRYDGRHYWIDGSIESRAEMEHLLDDMEVLCHDFEPSQMSPLFRCPTLAQPLRIA